jgi:hypothetical protein
MQLLSSTQLQQIQGGGSPAGFTLEQIVVVTYLVNNGII